MTRWHRLYFAAVGSFALWVGICGYLWPAGIENAIPWQIPPLHARFVGAMYLAGLVLMLGGLIAPNLRDVRIAILMTAIWTGMLLVVSLFHLGEFDFGHRPVWFWFFAYVVFPVAGAWLAWRHRPAIGAPPGSPVEGWVSTCLVIQGSITLVLALALLVAPGVMARMWPWSIPDLLAHLYSGPFMAIAIGSFLMARSRQRDELRLPTLSMLAFATLVLIASVLHRDLFEPWSRSAIVWFGGYAIAAAALLLIVRRITAPVRYGAIR